LHIKHGTQNGQTAAWAVLIGANHIQKPQFLHGFGKTTGAKHRNNLSLFSSGLQNAYVFCQAHSLRLAPEPNMLIKPDSACLIHSPARYCFARDRLSRTGYADGLSG
jgi:hypothetical protein